MMVVIPPTVGQPVALRKPNHAPIGFVYTV